VFEIGAGIGCTVKSFEFAGYRAAGIDPGIGFTTYAQQQLRARVRVADLFELPPVPDHDLVLLVHVIEHFRSPRRALTAIRKLLVDGGRLYVECPNLAAPFARRSQLFHYAHIHNFTPQTLTLLARRCGFRIERVFSTADDPNLQMLLTRGEVDAGASDATSYGATKDALARSEGLRYHLRWDYVRRRAVKVAAYLGEHVAAGRRTAQLIERARTSLGKAPTASANAA
jgi:SAM-dependent methyltransferase